MMKNNEYNYNGFEASGEGPTINGVQIQYSCGKEGYKEITASYSRRKKGYGKPKHSWHSLLRVFHYIGPDKWRLLLVTFITILMVLINLLGGFIAAPLVDALLQPAVYAATGNWLMGGSFSGYADKYINKLTKETVKENIRSNMFYLSCSFVTYLKEQNLPNEDKILDAIVDMFFRVSNGLNLFYKYSIFIFNFSYFYIYFF